LARGGKGPVPRGQKDKSGGAARREYGLGGSIVPIGDEIWLGAEKGLFRVDRKTNQAVPLAGNTGRVDAIVPVGDEIWLGGMNSAFRVDRKTNQVVPLGGDAGLVDAIVPIGDEIWFASMNGAFRVDPKAKLTVINRSIRRDTR
jgi:ligand-binding sensor domain-containing protein